MKIRNSLFENNSTLKQSVRFTLLINYLLWTYRVNRFEETE